MISCRGRSGLLQTSPQARQAHCRRDEAAKPWDLLPVGSKDSEDQRGGPPQRGWWSERGQEQRHKERNGCLTGNKGQGAVGQQPGTR